MNTNIINAGISKLNEAAQNEAIKVAQGLISDISGMLKSIASHKESNEIDRKSIKDLEALEFTYATIVGGEAPTAPNVNQTTILETLKKLNDSRQGKVAASAQILAGNIDSRNRSIVDLEKSIVELRAKLDKVTAEVIEAGQILG